MSYKVEPLYNSYAFLGEGPHWDVDTQNLYYVDLPVGKLLRYDYRSGKVHGSKINGEEFASFVIPIEGTSDKFVVGCERRVVVVTWNGVNETCDVDRTLYEVQTDEKYTGNRFNDAKCDPCGRLFAGTMRFIGDMFMYRLGELYKFEKGHKVVMVKDDIGISNGLVWTEKGDKFYFVDTTDYEVKEYDYDLKNGKIYNPRVIFDLRRASPEEHICPDGLTIDIAGNIYVATYNGHTVYKVDPRTRRVLLEIKMPCKQITSVAFGGPNLDILYVTTSAKCGEPYPAGSTFKVTGICGKGFPMTKFNIGLNSLKNK